MNSSWSAADRMWMRRACRYATTHLGATAPNPTVGCVVVRDGVEIGSGRHERCGGPHAEIMALTDCRARGNDPRGATVYVTLEPCSHHGRTPPCSHALIAAGVARVVAAVPDRSQSEAAAQFHRAGVAYEVGCEMALARHLHGGFLRRVRFGTVRCTGKWALTHDGYIGCLNARGQAQPLPISDPVARATSRRRRRVFDAIVVGVDTVIADDPRLLALPPPSDGVRQPRRVVVSATARLPLDGALVGSAGAAAVWVIHDARAPRRQVEALAQHGVQTVGCTNAHDPRQIVEILSDLGCNEVLVEGGAKIHAAFLHADLYQRLEIDQSARSLSELNPEAQAGIRIADVPLTGIPGPAFVPEIPARTYGTTQHLRLVRTSQQQP